MACNRHHIFPGAGWEYILKITKCVLKVTKYTLKDIECTTKDTMYALKAKHLAETIDLLFSKVNRNVKKFIIVFFIRKHSHTELLVFLNV